MKNRATYFEIVLGAAAQIMLETTKSPTLLKTLSRALFALSEPHTRIIFDRGLFEFDEKSEALFVLGYEAPPARA